MSASSSSFVWHYFERFSKDSAKCKKCLSVLSTKGSCTSGLIKHLKLKHQIDTKSGNESIKRKREVDDTVVGNPSDEKGKNRLNQTKIFN